MNNDNLNKKDSQQNKNLQGQQFFPGRMPEPPQFPRMENQPRTAPPNFTPEAPGMDRQSMYGGPSEFGRQSEYGRPSDYGQQFRGGDVQPRDLRRCLNNFTYIWLNNGNAFWFFPIDVNRQFVQGFRWRRNRWEYDRINLRRILFFRCF